MVPPYYARRGYRRAHVGGVPREHVAERLPGLRRPTLPPDLLDMWPVYRLVVEGHDLAAIDREWSILDVVRAGEALDVQADMQDAIADARRRARESEG